MKKLKEVVYLAGPMRGIPDYNFPLFHKIAGELRQKGYAVLNPAEFREVGAPPKTHPDAQSWYFRRDLRMITECDAVATLEGFESSSGASFEVSIAKYLKMCVKPWHQYP